MDTTPDSKTTITAILEELFREVQQAKELPDSLKATGGIEALLAIGLASELLTQDEVDVYVERSEGLAGLIQEKLIKYEPFVYLPDFDPSMQASEAIEMLLKYVT